MVTNIYRYFAINRITTVPELKTKRFLGDCLPKKVAKCMEFKNVSYSNTVPPKMQKLGQNK